MTGRKRASSGKARVRAPRNRAAKPVDPREVDRHANHDPGKTTAIGTSLVNKAGKPHAGVTTFKPSHGPNLADRPDTIDEHIADTQPKPTDAVASAAKAIPASRRIDEGQNTGGVE